MAWCHVFSLSLLPTSGLESRGGWCAGSPSNRKTQAPDFSEDHRRSHAGAGPRRHRVFAGATWRSPPLSATYFPFLQTVQPGRRSARQSHRLRTLWALCQVQLPNSFTSVSLLNLLLVTSTCWYMTARLFLHRTNADHRASVRSDGFIQAWFQWNKFAMRVLI